MFLICVCVSRIGLWGFDVAHLKMMQVCWLKNSGKQSMFIKFKG
jgi:hypothetical protein